MRDLVLLRLRSIGIWCVVLMLTAGCGSQEPQVIDPKDLQNIKLGEVVRVDGPLKKPAEAICVLTPYRSRLDEREPLSQLVNTHLKGIKYFGDTESAQAFVFVNGDAVTVQPVRTPGVTIVAHHEGALRLIKPVQCTAVARAVLTKVDSFVPALVLGEAK